MPCWYLYCWYSRTFCRLVIAGNKAVGFDANFTGATGWTGCGRNKYSESGATICIWCEAGKYSTTNEPISGPTVCKDCVAGTYGLGLALGCETCPPGKSSSTGATICV